MKPSRFIIVFTGSHILVCVLSQMKTSPHTAASSLFILVVSAERAAHCHVARNFTEDKKNAVLRMFRNGHLKTKIIRAVSS